jgi:hypothetical protein
MQSQLEVIEVIGIRGVSWSGEWEIANGKWRMAKANGRCPIDHRKRQSRIEAPQERRRIFDFGFRDIGYFGWPIAPSIQNPKSKMESQ